MKIGIFGGAFNPVHNGHINLAINFIDILKLDKLLVIPTNIPPHRNNDDFISGKDRLELLQIAFENIDSIEISDIELNSKEKNYTYNTLQEVKKIYGDNDYYLIIGEDQFLCFNEWYRYRDLINEITLCTASRGNSNKETLSNFANNNLDTNKYIIADYEPLEISSTNIRSLIKSNGNISKLMPEKVIKYIMDNKLYV